MTFPIPDDYNAPNGIKEGEDFKDVATFNFSDGKITLVSIGEKEAAVKSTKAASKPKPKGAAESIKESLDAGDSQKELSPA